MSFILKQEEEKTLLNRKIKAPFKKLLYTKNVYVKNLDALLFFLPRKKKLSKFLGSLKVVFKFSTL